jgi:hypothetical protein
MAMGIGQAKKSYPGIMNLSQVGNRMHLDFEEMRNCRKICESNPLF